MKYRNVRNNIILKQGGQIPKYQEGGELRKKVIEKYRLNHPELASVPDDALYNIATTQAATEYANEDETSDQLSALTAQNQTSYDTMLQSAGLTQDEVDAKKADLTARGVISNTTSTTTDTTTTSSPSFTDKFAAGNAAMTNSKLGSALGSAGMTDMIGGAAKAASKALDAVDNALMGDKNFGAQSAAIDQLADGAANAAIDIGSKFGPMGAAFGAAAAGAIKTANFISKAGGQTVQGFDVNINSSGYNDLGHMESSSSRDFGAFIGLGGLNRGKMQAKLARRNEQARMALNAAEIADDQKFEQEARSNSVENTLMNNQIALAGGLQTNLLGA